MIQFFSFSNFKKNKAKSRKQQILNSYSTKKEQTRIGKQIPIKNHEYGLNKSSKKLTIREILEYQKKSSQLPKLNTSTPSTGVDTQKLNQSFKKMKNFQTWLVPQRGNSNAERQSYSKITEIKLITVGLASPSRIRQWAEKTLPNGKVLGEVSNAETLHYKTFKPIKGGLFCERIFGPTKDHECACGKRFDLKTYLNANSATIKNNSSTLNQTNTQSFSTVGGTIGNNIDAKTQTILYNKLAQKRYFCRLCDVEYTYSTIRRTQLGYIQLATPVTHIWFVKGVPNYMSILLNMKKKDLQQVIYNYGVLTLENSLKAKQLVTIKPSDLYETWVKVAKVFPPTVEGKKQKLLKQNNKENVNSIQTTYRSLNLSVPLEGKTKLGKDQLNLGNSQVKKKKKKKLIKISQELHNLYLNRKIFYYGKNNKENLNQKIKMYKSQEKDKLPYFNHLDDYNYYIKQNNYEPLKEVGISQQKNKNLYNHIVNFYFQKKQQQKQSNKILSQARPGGVKIKQKGWYNLLNQNSSLAKKGLNFENQLGFFSLQFKATFTRTEVQAQAKVKAIELELNKRTTQNINTKLNIASLNFKNFSELNAINLSKIKIKQNSIELLSPSQKMPKPLYFLSNLKKQSYKLNQTTKNNPAEAQKNTNFYNFTIDKTLNKVYHIFLKSVHIQPDAFSSTHGGSNTKSNIHSKYKNRFNLNILQTQSFLVPPMVDENLKKKDLYFKLASVDKKYLILFKNKRIFAGFPSFTWEKTSKNKIKQCRELELGPVLNGEKKQDKLVLMLFSNLISKKQTKIINVAVPDLDNTNFKTKFNKKIINLTDWVKDYKGLWQNKYYQYPLTTLKANDLKKIIYFNLKIERKNLLKNKHYKENFDTNLIFRIENSLAFDIKTTLNTKTEALKLKKFNNLNTSIFILKSQKNFNYYIKYLITKNIFILISNRLPISILLSNSNNLLSLPTFTSTVGGSTSAITFTSSLFRGNEGETLKAKKGVILKRDKEAKSNNLFLLTNLEKKLEVDGLFLEPIKQHNNNITDSLLYKFKLGNKQINQLTPIQLEFYLIHTANFLKIDLPKYTKVNYVAPNPKISSMNNSINNVVNIIKGSIFLNKVTYYTPRSFTVGGQDIKNGINKSSIQAKDLIEINKKNLNVILKKNSFNWLINNIYCLSHRYVWEEDKEKRWRLFTLYYYPPRCLNAISIPLYKHRNYEELFRFEDRYQSSLDNILGFKRNSISLKNRIPSVASGYQTCYQSLTRLGSDAFIPFLFSQKGNFSNQPSLTEGLNYKKYMGLFPIPSSEACSFTFGGNKPFPPSGDGDTKLKDSLNKNKAYSPNRAYLQFLGMNINTTFSGAGMIQKLLNEFNFNQLKIMDKQNRILLFEYNKYLKFIKKLIEIRSSHKKQEYDEYYKACRVRETTIRRTKLIRKLLKKSTRAPIETHGLNMILTVLPVLPPDLRPIVKTDGKQATADLNTFYKNIIYRNERLKKFLKDPALNSSFEMKYAQRLVQEAVDNLIQNGKGGVTPVKDARGRLLKSLSEALKGKQGRFRQYLLGKRVDYSARSVIVVGPRLKLHECGIPKEIALALYFPFLIKRILNQKLALTVPGAKGLIQKKSPLIWQLLREIMRTCPVLLNRAPTLHRLGFQAFQPKLIEGKAILLHPLVCPAFNADFDGDQMAVHLPITTEAKAEAWKLMLSRNNLISPATGEPLILPSQDMVLGCYYLTTNCAEKYIKLKRGTGFYFPNIHEALKVYNQNLIDLHAVIWVNMNNMLFNSNSQEQPLEIRINLCPPKVEKQGIPSPPSFPLLREKDVKAIESNDQKNNIVIGSSQELPTVTPAPNRGLAKLGKYIISNININQKLIKTKLEKQTTIIYPKTHQNLTSNGILVSQIVRTTPGKILFNMRIHNAISKTPNLFKKK